MTQARKSNINAMLVALHVAGGPRTCSELLLARECAGMTAAQVAKTLDNMRLQKMVESDGGGGPKRPALWALTDVGREKIAQRGLVVATAAATKEVQPVVSPNEARPWAFAATDNAQLPDPPRALPAIAAEQVAGLPVTEVDIDAVHHNPRLKGMAEATFNADTGRTTPAADTNQSCTPDPEFLCALFSDGVLSITSNGKHLDLPLKHTRRLVRYLDGLAVDVMVGEAS